MSSDWIHNWLITSEEPKVFECAVCGIKITVGGRPSWRPDDRYVPISGPYRSLTCPKIAIKRVIDS